MWIAIYSTFGTHKTQVSVHLDTICNFESGIRVRFDISTGAAPKPNIPDEFAAWTRTNLRTYLYPSEWDHFMYMHECQNAEAADLLAIMPQKSLKGTLHCDAGPAFIGLSKCVLIHIIAILFYAQQRFRNTNVDRTACAKHLETNITSCAANIKDPAMELLYGRCITIHMAYNIRDAIFTALHSSSCTLSKKTKDWFTATFGTDDGMRVSVHSQFPIAIFWTDTPQINTQAFRNFLTTSGYCADSLVENYFRNNKGRSKEKFGFLAPTYATLLLATNTHPKG